MPAMEPLVARHVLTILTVEDLERSREFYEAAFGWPRAVDVPVYVELSVPGGMRLGLYQRLAFAANTGQSPDARPSETLSGAEIYLFTEDVEAALARLLSAGARLLSEPAERPWGDLAAYVADPDGHVLVVACPPGTAA